MIFLFLAVAKWTTVYFELCWHTVHSYATERSSTAFESTDLTTQWMNNVSTHMLRTHTHIQTIALVQCTWTQTPAPCSECLLPFNRFLVSCLGVLDLRVSCVCLCSGRRKKRIWAKHGVPIEWHTHAYIVHQPTHRSSYDRRQDQTEKKHHFDNESLNPTHWSPLPLSRSYSRNRLWWFYPKSISLSVSIAHFHSASTFTRISHFAMMRHDGIAIEESICICFFGEMKQKLFIYLNLSKTIDSFDYVSAQNCLKYTTQCIWLRHSTQINRFVNY